MRVAVAVAVVLASSQVQAGGSGFVVAGARQPSISGFATRAPARDTFAAHGWHAIYDRDTGVAAFAWGTPIAAQGAMKDAAIAEGIARTTLAEHLALLAPGATVDDFVLVANRVDGNLRTIGFAQMSHGMPVLGGQLGFVFGNDRLFAISSQALPDVRVALPRKRATDATKLARAEAWLARDTGMRVQAHTTGEHVIVPIVFGAGDIAYHVVDIVDVSALSGGERWHVYVAADGSPVARKSLVMKDSSATLAFNVGVRYGTGTRADTPAPTTSLTVDGTMTMTAADGTFTWPTTNAATIVPEAGGPHVRVTSVFVPPPTTLTAQPGSTVVWNRSADQYGDAILSAYIYASTAKTRARVVNPSVIPWLNGILDVYVNGTQTYCNAYSTGDDIHFFIGNSVCDNSARIADIVYHEFGHSLHKHSVIDGMGDFEVALSEGLGDFYAALITEDSGLARGFHFTNAPDREIDPIGVEKSYPQDVAADPHETGLIISGALWDLRKQLVAELGATAGTAVIERIFAGVMMRAPKIPGAYMAALIADDNDANLANGTPHICQINTAFAPHGLRVDLHMTTIGPATLTGLALDVPVADTVDCQRVMSMTVTWQSSTGASGSFALAPQSPTTMWSGTFPDQPASSVLSYSIVATLADGSTRALPDNAADPMYQRFIGETKPIWCTNFDQDPRWRASATSGVSAWQWDRPRGGLDPAAAFTGSHVLGNVLVGDGLYASGEHASIDTPEIDLEGFSTVHLQYWRWLTTQDGTHDEATISALHDTGGPTELWHNLAMAGIDHVDREWRFHDIDLGSFATSDPVHLRWDLESDGAVELGGWTIDDVCVVTADPSVCGDSEISGAEECDDGNRTDGDGCSKLCRDEGGCCSASPNPLGPLVLATLLGLRLRRRRRMI
ncbi:MAG TPA: DUF4215 domain-containing protein [Kofleriaceae bacterium]|nr:DUF4215 domain-containing protein [Kofleriaceae bacterium]